MPVPTTPQMQQAAKNALLRALIAAQSPPLGNWTRAVLIFGCVMAILALAFAIGYHLAAGSVMIACGLGLAAVLIGIIKLCLDDMDRENQKWNLPPRRLFGLSTGTPQDTTFYWKKKMPKLQKLQIALIAVTLALPVIYQDMEMARAIYAPFGIVMAAYGFLHVLQSLIRR